MDPTGQYCAERQVDEIWFLAGVSGSDKAERTCAIPSGKSLFFPLINTAYFAFLNDPPETRTEEYVRKAGSCTQPAHISVSIDGFKILQPLKYFTGPSGSESPIFNAQLPPDNLFGVQTTDPNGQNYARDLALSPSAEQGYYLFLYPLSPGKHTIQWQASGCTLASTKPPTPASQDITYHLTVAK